MKSLSPVIVLLGLAASITLAVPATHYSMGSAGLFIPETGDEVNTISFANGYTIDTRIGEPEIPAELRLPESQSGKPYHVIQFNGPLRHNWLRRLERLGVHPTGYLPNYAVVARLDGATETAVRALPMVHWVGLFQPAYKIEDGLLAATGTVRVVALLMPDEKAEPVTNLVSDLGGAIDDVTTSPFGTTITVTVNIADITALARLQEVLWLQHWSQAEVANDNCQWVTQTGWRSGAPAPTDTAARKVWTRGVRGQRVILSTTDTGCNLGHDMFRDPAMSVTPPGIWPNHRKVVAFKLINGSSATESPYHGSHVNGTVAGDDSVTGGTSYYDGMSFKGRLYFVDLTNSSGGFTIGNDLWPLWDTVHAGTGLPDSIRPIKQQSGSWRAYNSNGTYLLMDASTDAYCWAHKDFLNIMAAGNEGSTARTIGNPAIAKNVLTVGATSNGTGSNAIAGFSSRGPTQDNRVKPNIMAPGVSLNSAYYTGSNTYQSMSGTSMATPATNGAVGLIRCYLQEGFYPTGARVPSNGLSYISAALLRSMAMASADSNVGSYVIPSYDIGWGRIDVDSVLYFTGDTRKLIIRDDTSGVATGEYKEMRFRVVSTATLRIVLAWTDTAAAPNANPTLVNNLNLEVVAPGGTYYRGNKYTAGQSTANPTGWDSLNVEECVRVNTPTPGVWTIRVRGQQVVTSVRQPFAWTITGDVSDQIVDVGTTVIAAPTGTIDSTQNVTPACSVFNYGTAAASYNVRMRIGSAYNNTASVTSHTPGTRLYVTFPAASAWPRGSQAVTCSTQLSGDLDNSNDRRTGSVLVRVLDAQALTITAPTGQVDSGTAVTPQAQVRNNGNQTASFTVVFSIGSGFSNTQPVDTLAAGATRTISFASWTAGQRGAFTTACTTRLTGDMVPANNRTTGTVNVRVHDIAAVSINAPTSGPPAPVNPTAMVLNRGNVREPSTVTFAINSTPPYSQTLTLSGGLPYSDTLLQFPTWTPPATGGYRARCSTYLGADQIRTNDTVSASFTIGRVDAAAVSIRTPTGRFDSGTTVVPSAWVRNLGDFPATFSTWFALDSAGTRYYTSSKPVTGLVPGDSAVVLFDTWAKPHLPGRYVTSCSAYAAWDDNPGNDKVTGELRVTARPDWPLGWYEVNSMPLLPSGKGIKDGGWLAYDDATGRFYAAKGNKTGDFYAYDPLSDTWYTKSAIPTGTEGKPAYKSAAGCSDGSGVVYATKGNNTSGFWVYDAATDAWQQRKDVPLGLSNKKLKSGTDLQYVQVGDSGFVYLLKGYRAEFYRYNVLKDTWQPLPNVPGTPKCDKGSFLAYDGSGLLYAHKAKYHELNAFDIGAGAWGPALRPMPFINSMGKSKKSKDGGCGTWLDGAIYALKGGNTQEFWRYLAAGDSWTELETLPAFGSTGKKKKVKAGADIAGYDAGSLFALKGNKALELWRYAFAPAILGRRPVVARGGVQTSALKPQMSGTLNVVPNPLVSGLASVSFSLPALPLGRARVLLSVYDAAGRRVKTMEPLERGQSGTVDLDLRALPAGIYVVKLTAPGFRAAQKLVIQR